jgi:hypothetical protein
MGSRLQLLHYSTGDVNTVLLDLKELLHKFQFQSVLNDCQHIQP